MRPYVLFILTLSALTLDTQRLAAGLYVVRAAGLAEAPSRPFTVAR